MKAMPLLHRQQHYEYCELITGEYLNNYTEDIEMSNLNIKRLRVAVAEYAKP